MTLNEALALIKLRQDHSLTVAAQHRADTEPRALASGQNRDVFLVCGFQPLHVATFLKVISACEPTAVRPWD